MAVRWPSVWYRMGGQDEQWYSVPGWTVANEGLPRIPYVPVNEPESVFQGADRVLYALPPAYFYLQAPFFWLFPAGYGTARLAAWISGAGALLGVYILARLLDLKPLTAGVAVTICAFGRAFYFPWQDTRPDMLCAALGVASMVVLLASREHRRSLGVAVAGFLVGMAGLSHPYAVIFAFQLAVLIALTSASFKRFCWEAILAAVMCLAGLSLWLPMISIAPELFEAQFTRNVLSRSGPGLTQRILWPWSYFPYQMSLITERLGGIQLAMLALALAWGGARVFGISRAFAGGKQASKVARIVKFAREPFVLLFLLASSALYLHVASLGMHPAQGYLCYLWCMISILTAAVLQGSLDALTSKLSAFPQTLISLAAYGLVLVLLAPGSGARAVWTYATRNHELNYNRQAFCAALDRKLPEGARLIVSPEYVFEFELLGRKPVNASRIELYHDVVGLPFDYLIASTQALDEKIPESLKCEALWEMGDATDPLACFVRIYRPGPDTPINLNWPRDSSDRDSADGER